MNRVINEVGLSLIKSFEGFSAVPYADTGGVWTIGYGHTREVTPNTPPISQESAQVLLQEDLSTAQNEVVRLIKVSLTDNQFAALVSLVFNCGSAPLLKTLGAKLNAEDYAGAADEFLKWDHDNGKVVDGLARRRSAERDLFLTS